MTAHKYADLFKAKLDNMELVLFEKHYSWDKWTECNTATRVHATIFFVSDNFEYFLCLPQHKEACLHWLNGGVVDLSWQGDGFSEYVASVSDLPWCEDLDWMDNGCVFRIKPRKEKRWIITGVKWITSQKIYKSHDDAVRDYNGVNKQYCQIVEIEVEV